MRAADRADPVLGRTTSSIRHDRAPTRAGPSRCATRGWRQNRTC